MDISHLHTWSTPNEFIQVIGVNISTFKINGRISDKLVGVSPLFC